MVNGLKIMLYHNDFICHNLDERLLNNLLDFKVEIFPKPFQIMKFHDAADYTCKQIYTKYKNLYLSFSGGADSEYVLRCFVKNSIPIVPIIILTDHNEFETDNAIKTCKELNVQPITIPINRYKFLKLYYDNIVKKLNGTGWEVTGNLITSEFISNKNGILILGNHFMGDSPVDINNVVYAHEWDFYNDVLTNQPCINFFYYNFEIFYAMIDSSKNLIFNKDKCKLYGITDRLKRHYEYRYNDYFKMIKKIDDRIVPKNISYIGTSSDVLKKFKKYIIKND